MTKQYLQALKEIDDLSCDYHSELFPNDFTSFKG